MGRRPHQVSTQACLRLPRQPVPAQQRPRISSSVSAQRVAMRHVCRPDTGGSPGVGAFVDELFQMVTGWCS
jgi:hypothetical protein